MHDSPIMMLAGLGNPGAKYTRTRHNIGFRVVDEIADIFSLPLDKSRFNTLYSKGLIKKVRVVLAEPQSFMNRSGFPIQRISSYFKVNTSDIIVIHDDLDLEFGKVKIAKNRGHGGHNGIKSIIEALGTKDFIRVRIGIGRPREYGDVTGHVLSGFSQDEEKELVCLVEKAVEACVAVIEQGVKKAMTTCNSRS